MTQIEIDALIAKLKKFPYACAAGTNNFGPLSGPPQIEGDVELKDTTLYETEGDVEASFLTKNNVKVTIKTRAVDVAMPLLAAFAKGDNVLATANSVALTLVPITSASGEKTITFPNAFLQPGLSYAPGENSEPSEVTLVYLCRPDATSGKPFTYGTGE